MPYKIRTLTIRQMYKYRPLKKKTLTGSKISAHVNRKPWNLSLYVVIVELIKRRFGGWTL